MTNGKTDLALRLLVLGMVSCALNACATRAQNIGLGYVVATAVGAQAPTTDMEVIYYLGVFDPQDQLPPTIYRVRVHGQASFISRTKFASGWVRAELVDSLNTGGKFEATGDGIKLDDANTLTSKGLATGRRLVMFGPEGFREAPRDHRLVIVMGSDPAAFFSAVDSSLGDVVTSRGAQQNSALINELFVRLARLKGESDRLGDLATQTASSIPGNP